MEDGGCCGPVEVTPDVCSFAENNDKNNVKCENELSMTTMMTTKTTMIMTTMTTTTTTLSRLGGCLTAAQEAIKGE